MRKYIFLIEGIHFMLLTIIMYLTFSFDTNYIQTTWIFIIFLVKLYNNNIKNI